MKPLIVFSDVTFDGRSLVGRPKAFGRPKLYFRYLKSYFQSAQFILLEDVAFCSKVRSYDHILTRRLARLFPPSYSKSSRTFRPGLSTPAFFLSMPFGFPRMASLGTWVNRPTRNN
jgi:hypothetical protein